MLAVGAITVWTAPAPVAPIAPFDAQERLAAITAAIAQLDPSNMDAWLKDGKPNTEAITAVLGWSISAAERNTAWAALQG